MRAILGVGLLLTLACNPPAEKPLAAEPKPNVAAPEVLATPAAPQDEAAVMDRTKQLVEAVDAGDAEAVAPMLAEGFMHVIPGRFNDAEFLLSRLRARKQKGYPRYGDRSYDSTKVRFFGGTAIVTMTASATVLPAQEAAPGKSAHTMSLVWSWQDGAWKLTTWTEADAGREMDRLAWNRTYREGGAVNLEPNRLLVDTVQGRKPGRALDLGMGQGRNAIYLASQGWDVTGVDISDVGIEQANEAAKAAGVDAKLHTKVADFRTFDFGENAYDLVAFIYMGPTPPVDPIRRALRPGGVVVFEHFAADPRRPDADGLRQGHLSKLFADGFKVLRDEHVIDDADWGHVKVPLVRFVAEKR
jgi:SAM-dependent methyltransferase